MSINTIPTDKDLANISACIGEGWELLPVYLNINEQMMGQEFTKSFTFSDPGNDRKTTP